MFIWIWTRRVTNSCAAGCSRWQLAESAWVYSTSGPFHLLMSGCQNVAKHYLHLTAWWVFIYAFQRQCTLSINTKMNTDTINIQRCVNNEKQYFYRHFPSITHRALIATPLIMLPRKRHSSGSKRRFQSPGWRTGLKIRLQCGAQLQRNCNK